MPLLIIASTRRPRETGNELLPIRPEAEVMGTIGFDRCAPLQRGTPAQQPVRKSEPGAIGYW